jgi:3-hydroxymyristoyl/3-hydroxydecanoyl-(acyl carrier protein) dehydratase
MAQVGGIPMHQDDGIPAYIVAMDGFEFDGTVKPGDIIRIEGTIEWTRGNLFKALVEATTENGRVARGHILYAAEGAMHGNGIAPHANGHKPLATIPAREKTASQVDA